MAEGKFQFLGFRFPKVEMRFSDTFPQPDEKLNNTINVSKMIDGADKRRVVIQIDVAIQNEMKTLDIGLQVKGIFLAIEDMPDEMFARFCDQNAPAILFPYARALLSSITAQAGIAPLILPTINFSSSPGGEPIAERQPAESSQ